MEDKIKITIAGIDYIQGNYMEMGGSTYSIFIPADQKQKPTVNDVQFFSGENEDDNFSLVKDDELRSVLYDMYFKSYDWAPDESEIINSNEDVSPDVLLENTNDDSSFINDDDAESLKDLGVDVDRLRSTELEIEDKGEDTVFEPEEPTVGYEEDDELIENFVSEEAINEADIIEGPLDIVEEDSIPKIDNDIPMSKDDETDSVISGEPLSEEIDNEPLLDLDEKPAISDLIENSGYEASDEEISFDMPDESEDELSYKKPTTVEEQAEVNEEAIDIQNDDETELFVVASDSDDETFSPEDETFTMNHEVSESDDDFATEEFDKIEDSVSSDYRISTLDGDDNDNNDSDEDSTYEAPSILQEATEEEVKGNVNETNAEVVSQTIEKPKKKASSIRLTIIIATLLVAALVGTNIFLSFNTPDATKASQQTAAITEETLPEVSITENVEVESTEISSPEIYSEETLLDDVTSDFQEETLPVEISSKPYEVPAEAKYGFVTIKRLLDSKLVVRFMNDVTDTIIYIDENSNQDALLKMSPGCQGYIAYSVNDGVKYFITYELAVSGVLTQTSDASATISTSTDETTYTISSELGSVFQELKIGSNIKAAIRDRQIIAVQVAAKNYDDTNIVTIAADINKVPLAQNLINSSFSQSEYALMADQDHQSYDSEYFSSDFTDNSVKFYNSYSDPIWIRFKWKSNNPDIVTPEVSDVKISIISPSGIKINDSNVADYGRMWIEGDIVNIALNKPETGGWTLVADKTAGTFLGQTNFHLMKLTGFITIDKFKSVSSNKSVDFYWSVGGVSDDALSLSIALVNSKYSTIVFSGSTKKDNIHLIDHVTIDTTNIPAGTYNVVATVKDIDLIDGEKLTAAEREEYGISPSQIVVTAETITDTKTTGKVTIN